MRKLLLLLVLACYSLSSIGAVVELHYCMSKFTGATLAVVKQPSKCSKCGVVKAKKACCKDEDKLIKVKDAHLKATILFHADAPAMLVRPQDIFRQFKPLERSEVENIQEPSPPEIPTPALFILNNVFRI